MVERRIYGADGVLKGEEREVVIIVPLYTSKLTPLENISLMQLYRVLNKYPICYVMPERMRDEFAGSAIWAEYFPNQYFQSTKSYSQLCLSLKFYERFQDFEYLLIYQTDAFVFSDGLHYFCSLGVDYIGAPLGSYQEYWKDIQTNVGNGGLSLRKVSACIRVLRDRDNIYRRRPESWDKNYFLEWEDLFWAFCSKQADVDFTVPDVHTSLSFAVDWDYGHVYRKMPDWLPFGCHGWFVHDYYHWKPIIESFGYSLPEGTMRQLENAHRRGARKYILRRALRYSGASPYQEILTKVFPKGKNITLWGMGTYGKICRVILENIGKNISYCFDQKVKDDSSQWKDGLLCLKPTQRRLQTLRIPLIVTTLSYEEEISNELLCSGAQKNRDFFLLTDIMNQMLDIIMKQWRTK